MVLQYYSLRTKIPVICTMYYVLVNSNQVLLWAPFTGIEVNLNFYLRVHQNVRKYSGQILKENIHVFFESNRWNLSTLFLLYFSFSSSSFRMATVNRENNGRCKRRWVFKSWSGPGCMPLFYMDISMLFNNSNTNSTIVYVKWGRVDSNDMESYRLNVATTQSNRYLS